MAVRIHSRKQAPLLLVNQAIGPLFADVAAEAQRRSAVQVFHGLTYRRTPAAARLLTWMGFSLQLAWHLLWRGRHYSRLLVVSNPPLAPLLAPLARRPYALLLYDLYPQVLRQLQPRSPLGRWGLELLSWLWHRANRLAFSGAERVFTLSPAMAEELRPAFRSRQQWQRTVQVIPPWADTAALRPDPAGRQAFRASQGIAPDRLLITYAGNLGLTHPLEPLLDAAAQWQGSNVHHRPQMLLIGDGPKRAALERRAAMLGLEGTTLRFLNPLSFSELPACLSAADLAVVALDGPAAAASLPSKTFSALACGTPLLAITPSSSALAQLVQEHHCGLVIEPGPTAASDLQRAVEHLATSRHQLHRYATNALQASTHYSPANAERLLDAWLGPRPDKP